MRNEELMENIEGGAGWEGCLSDDILLSYFEGALPENGARMVQRHLNSCSTCFQITVSLMKNSQSPYGDAEEKEVEKLIAMAPEEQVAKIISYVGDPPSRARPVFSLHIKAPGAKLVSATNKLHLRPWLLPVSRRPGFAFAAVLALSGSIIWGIRFYNTTLKILGAEHILKNNYHIYMAETPRLSGGYASTGIQVLMGPEEDDAEIAYLEEARTRIAAAMASGSRAAKALLLLAQIAIIEKDYAKADSILHAILPKPKYTAAVLNDLGVLQFERNDWQGAARYFEAAIRADEMLTEARYNFALAKGRLGAKDEAIRVLNECVKAERDEGWRNAALEFRKELQKDKVD